MAEEITIPDWLEEALTKYKAKLDFVILEPKLREIKEKMDTRATVKQVELQDLQLKVSKILSDRGVYADWNLIYCSYALQLMRVKKRFHPSVWAWVTDYKRELKIVAQKWSARGLDKAIMLEIAKVVGTPEIEEYLI
jgi:hypothetical protein